MYYNDIPTGPSADYETRQKVINKIRDQFDVTNDEMSFASASARMGLFSELYTEYFVASCISAARDIYNDDYKHDEDEWSVYERIGEEADSAVPHQTYVLWTIWVDTGYNSEYLAEHGYDRIPTDELVKIPQITLYVFAEQIITHVYDKLVEAGEVVL